MAGDEPPWRKQNQCRGGSVIQVIMTLVKNGIQQPVRNVVWKLPWIREREQLGSRLHIHIEMSFEEAAGEGIVIAIQVVAPDKPVSSSVCLPQIIRCDEADYERPCYAVPTGQFHQILPAV